MKVNPSFYGKIITGTVSLMMLAATGHAILTLDYVPKTVMKDSFSELSRPEGIAFTPSGDYIAIANSFGNAITFYKRVGDRGSAYETSPAFSIKGEKSKLDFPHDLTFSPDGNHLAVANRHGNAITVYAKDSLTSMYNAKPIVVISGKASKIVAPSSVRYSPVNHLLAVANTEGHTITLYRYYGDVYSQKPYQTIRDTSNVLSKINSLDFSKDGKLLAAAIIDNDSLLIYQRVEGSRTLYTPKPTQIIHGQDTNLCCPHSVSFHPSMEYLAVSNAQGRKNINIFQVESEGYKCYGPLPASTLEVTEMYDESTIHLVDKLRHKGGCKGVSFSPDGASLAVTQNLAADGVQVPFSVGMLLVYPVHLSPAEEKD
jgi:DNA-binding beta-propeller fold protein YncE